MPPPLFFPDLASLSIRKITYPSRCKRESGVWESSHVSEKKFISPSPSCMIWQISPHFGYRLRQFQCKTVCPLFCARSAILTTKSSLWSVMSTQRPTALTWKHTTATDLLPSVSQIYCPKPQINISIIIKIIIVITVITTSPPKKRSQVWDPTDPTS